MRLFLCLQIAEMLKGREEEEERIRSQARTPASKADVLFQCKFSSVCGRGETRKTVILVCVSWDEKSDRLVALPKTIW